MPTRKRPAHRLRWGFASLGAASVAAVVVIAPGNAAEPHEMAPLYSAAPDEVEGRYLVVLKSGGSAMKKAMSSVKTAGGTIRHTYRTALHGFSADLPDSAVAKLRRNPNVAYVQTVRTHQYGSGAGTANRATGADAGAQSEVPFHLDRIDQRNLPLDNKFTAPGDGKGVNVYVVDSGIRSTHKEFEGRVVDGFSSIDDDKGTEDCQGHGTFVASQIGGKTFGVAKKAKLHAVRVLNCKNSGTTEQIVAGMDWVAKNFKKPAVANLSLESFGNDLPGEPEPAMDQAAKGMIDAGLPTVTITGNFGRGDCQNSPKDPRAITMAASTKDDERNAGLNASSYGPCVTAFAPGADITAAGISSDTAVQKGFFGTSFAAPLATGAVALELQKNPNLTMAQAKDRIIANSTKGVLKEIGKGSPNRLLFIK
ncbi:S8 family peptidase [Streptomyces sp. KR80]|uniref:S8 family peptidase n=1 Tax=Streptomyces sp. KR80 TaxID=3457426 RepID=UPI003FD48912